MADLLGILRIKDSNGNWVSVPGLKGDTGEPFKILGIYATAAALEAAVTDPEVGDVYLVGTTGAYDIYLYLADGWHNTGRYMPKGDQGDPAPQSTITSAVETWLAANVDPESGYVLDRSLSSQNAAAPADLVGGLKESLTLKAPAAIDTGESSVVLRIKNGAEGGKVTKITLSSVGLASETVTICGKNLIKSIKNGYYDVATGDFVANNTWRATDHIRCNAGESFYASSNVAISSLTVLFYDEGGAYLGNYNGRYRAFVAPENAFSMAMYGNRTALEGNFQVEQGVEPTEFESYRENYITIDFDGTESDAFEVNNPELTTFYGSNSVWSQNGGISITYSADTGLFVGEKNAAVNDSLAALAAEIKRQYTFSTENNECSIQAGDKIKITNNSETANASASTRDIYGNTVETISSNIPKGRSVVFTASSDAEILYFYSSDATATFSVEFLGTIGARVDALEDYHANPIPDYYQSMIASKTQTVRENMMSVGKNGDTFIFITDIHWQNNRKNSPALIKYLIDNLNVDKVFIGGDLITQGERNVMATDMLECVKAYTFPDTMLPIAFGNHDSNWVNYGSQRDDPTRHFDIKAVYALICKQAEPYVTFTSGFDCGLYFDNSNDKTRYIFLDTGEDDSSYRVFTAFDELAETLNGTPDGFKVVIVAHIVTYGIFTANIEPMLDAYNAKSTYAINGKTYDFSGAKGRVVIAIGGHTHVDSDHTTSGGIPVVVTTCDRIKSDDEVGTTDEQAFEVVTLDYSNNQAQFVRVGRGANRAFTLG